ncbi:hypothetical protein [Asticcacaulis sp. AC402]|uniref:hypothetical protein n=1 Tax=Asticcacaulis sp. AC402 TaxID=1282361 RepID=UPI0012DE2163|nr:hypothetical protein [Asticcacaulis sp. AC402]
MKKFDWNISYLRRLTLAAALLIGVGLVYKICNDGAMSLLSHDFRKPLLSVFVGGFITVVVVYTYNLISQFFKSPDP